MAITDNTPNNVHRFPGGAAVLGAAAIESTACREIDFDDERIRMRSVIKLLGSVIQGEDNVGERTLLIEELEPLITVIKDTLPNMIVAVDPDRVRRKFSHLFLENPEWWLENCLGNMATLLRFLAERISDNRHNEYRTHLLTHLGEEFQMVYDLLDQVTLRPRPPQPIAQ